MKKALFISQSNYLPWKGFFDTIDSVDEYVMYDDVQFTRRDWRNRNLIKTPRGLEWLSIPVESRGKMFQRIRDVRIADPTWADTHWKTLQINYRSAPHFAEFSGPFEAFYRNCQLEFLSEVNHSLLKVCCELLGIKTPITSSSDYELVPGRTEKLVSICVQAGANQYHSGPAAKSYLQEDLFAQNGISVHWASYSGYAPYHQLFGPFEHGVSVVDLLFNEGPNSGRFLKRTQESLMS